MNISFDFDGTLDKERIQKLALKFIKDSHHVVITTSRLDNNFGRPEWNIDLWKLSTELGILKQHVYFTNGADKWKYLKDFDIHFDDDQNEIELIDKHLTDCIGILIIRN